MKLSFAIRGYFLDLAWSLPETTIAIVLYLYRAHLNFIFVEFVGDKEIEAITRFDVIEFLNHLQNPTRIVTIHCTMYAVRLSTLWTWAAVELVYPT